VTDEIHNMRNCINGHSIRKAENGFSGGTLRNLMENQWRGKMEWKPIFRAGRIWLSR
jgi:hypothetical protein